MSKFQALRDGVAKAEHVQFPSFAALRPHLEGNIDTIDSLAAKKADLSKNTHLSDEGRAAQLRDIAALHAPAVAKADRLLAKARMSNRQKIEAHMPTIKNPADLGEALQRQEIRAILRTKSPTEGLAIATAENAPRLVIEAVLEGSQLTHGIPSIQVEQIRDIVATRVGGAQLAALREEAAALDYAGVVIADARGALNDAANFKRKDTDASLSEAFAQWFVAAAGQPEPAEEAEFAAAMGDVVVSSSIPEVFKSMDTAADRVRLGEFLTRRASAA